MRQNETFKYYDKYVNEMNDVYNYLKSLFETDYITELCAVRGYVSNNQKELIKEMQLGYCEPDVEILKNASEELGLLSKKGYFLLTNRFIIPVYDLAGNLCTLIGYYPDNRKYITLPTPFFSRECMFFNFKQAYDLSFKEYDGFVILVEGIFDCLSLRSIGLPAIATMGATVSEYKCELLKLFSKVLAIPDDDKTGRRALNRYDKKYGWKVPSNTTMLKFHGGTIKLNDMDLHCKDMDNFVSWYEEEDVRDILLSYRSSREDIEELYL